MATCILGERKCRRIERMTGRRVIMAKVRGGWEHFWAEVRFHDGGWGWVNYKTGASEPVKTGLLNPVPWWPASGPFHFAGEGI